MGGFLSIELVLPVIYIFFYILFLLVPKPTMAFIVLFCRHCFESLAKGKLIWRKYLGSNDDEDDDDDDSVFADSCNMVLIGATPGQVSLFLPHIIFFLYKIGQSVFSPTTKLYLYSSICSDQFGTEPFHYPTVTEKQIVTTVTKSNVTTPLAAAPPWLMDSPGAALTSPILVTNPPEPVQNFTSCQQLTGDQEDDLQMEAADYIMAMKILQDVPAFVLGMFCGGWSDRVGRRLPMMLPCFGGIIVTLIFVFIQLSGGIAVPGILFGVALNSFTGRNTLVSMAVQAYITDHSTEKERTRQLGNILAMNFFGLFGGSFLMALLADRVSFWALFLTVSFIYATALALIYFCLPESVLPTHHQHNTNKLSSSSSFNNAESQQQLQNETLIQKLLSCFRMDNFTDTLMTVVRDRPNNMRRYLILAYLCIVLHNMCKSGEIDVLLLFVKHTPLNWTKSEYGYLLSFQYASVGLLLIFVLPFLLNTLQLSDSSIIIGCVIAKV